MSKVSSILRSHVAEGPNSAEAPFVRNELLLCLIDAVEEQTAVQDDTLHGELVAMRKVQERQAEMLEVIAERLEVLPDSLTSNLGHRSELVAALRGLGRGL